MKNNSKQPALTRFSVCLGSALLLAMALPRPSKAGNGSFHNGAHNFCVSVRFNATNAQLQQIRTAFQNGSQILADATDGQHTFGTVTIVNDSGASQSAEYWVNSGAGRAYATQGQYGVRGQHVNLFFNSDFQTNNGADGDAYTVAHEHAHHSYGVLDEYSGPSGNAECAAPPDTANLNFSLMDNYFTRGGRAFGAGYTLNEFCVAANHDPDTDTWQESVHGMSCWEVIAAHPRRSATAPAGLPTDAPPGGHTVTFRNGIGGLRVMLLLDRSGSMSIQNRLTFAKLGAKQFINFVRVDDGLGVASFSSSASVNFPLTTVTGSGTRATARAAVDSLSASGATNIGGGLLAALGQITSQTNRSCNEIIVLLSDGDHNTGTSPGAVIPQLQMEGVTVLSVGVGSGLSTSGEATLQNIATQTGGKFFRVSNAFDLVALFFRLVFESIGNGLMTRAPEVIASGEVREIPVLVESGADGASFVLTLAQATDDIELSLQTPSGTVITAADAASDPNVEFVADTNSQVFQVNSPEAGEWGMIIAAGTVTSGMIEALAFGDHEGVQLNLAVLDDTVTFPESVHLLATPTFAGESVVGATVEGSVSRPDGSSVPVTLFDDGLALHGDALPGDGTYSALFNSYSEDGTYTFEVTVRNVSGMTYAGEEFFSLDPSNEESVPEFVRTATSTAVVTGVPDFVVATVEYGPETINLKSKGRFVTAYIELPSGFDVTHIDPGIVAITAIDGAAIPPIPARSRPTEIGDFDNDGIADLMVKFSRSELQQVLSPGMRAIQLEGFVDGQLFVGERSVGVIRPGK